MGTHRPDVVGDNCIKIFVGEGEYIIPTSTVFGLTVDEAKQLQAEGLKMADHDRRNEGFEVHGASPFKVRIKNITFAQSQSSQDSIFFIDCK